MKFQIIKTQKFKRLQQDYELLLADVANATAFIKTIENGTLDSNYAGLDMTGSGAAGSLAEALISMRNKMQQIAQRDKERNWITEGLATFIDILRNSDKSIDILYQKIISNLVKYVGANQGALYILNNNDVQSQSIDMVACYAYNKQKYVSKSFAIGEGLVGQAYLEKETMYLTDIPDRYISITSGLGTANPTALLIVPLKLNGQVYGILELASFAEFMPHQREFVEKLGESIASTISNAKTDEQTRQLLETAQLQAEQMRAQEEEMRQNLEELQATQEEMSRRITESNSIQSELTARMVALDAAALMSEADIYGNITYVNDKFCEVAKWRKEEVIGKPHNILRHPDTPKEVFKEMWQTIKSGKVFRGTYKNKAKDGSTYWVEATIAPVLGEDGTPVKYVGVRFDITEQMEKANEVKTLLDDSQQYTEELRAQEEELRQNLEELSTMQEDLSLQMQDTEKLKREMEAREWVFNKTTVLSETDLYGTITYVNDKFCEVSKYTAGELIGRPHNMLRHPDMPKQVFKLFWDTIKSGEVFRGIIKNRAKDGSHYWVDAVVSPVLDEYGKPERYIAARYVIEDNALAESLYAKMLEDLKIKQLIQI
jgi:PAS domain S-box-containing protein